MCNSFIRSKTVRALKPRRPMFRRRTRFPMKNLPMFRLHRPSLMFRCPGSLLPDSVPPFDRPVDAPESSSESSADDCDLDEFDKTYPMSFSPRMNRCRTNLSFCPIRRSPPNLYAFRCNTPADYLYHNNMSMTDSFSVQRRPHTRIRTISYSCNA